MLVKKELKEVPPCDCPEFAKKVLGQAKYVAAAKVCKLSRCGEILTVDYYSIEGYNLQARFFSDGKNYIIHLPERDEWTTRKLTTLFGDDGGMTIPCTEKAEELACDFLNVGTATWRSGYNIGWYRHIPGVYGVCSKFIHTKEERRHEAERENKYRRQQEHLGMFPQFLPDPVYRWVDEKVMDTYIFFSNLDKKQKRSGVCGYCHKRFTLPADVRHKQKGVCPKCGKAAEYCAERYDYSKIDKVTVCYPLKVDNQLLLQWSRIERTYSNKRPHFNREDFAVTLYLNKKGKQAIYSYGLSLIPYQYYYGYQWCDWGCTPVYREAYVYPNDLKEIFGTKYHGVDLQELFLNNAPALDFVRLIDNLKLYPITEYLVKLKLFNFATSSKIETLNTDGRSFQEVFGIAPNYLSMYVKHGVTMREHLIIENAKEFVTGDLLERCRKSKPLNEVTTTIITDLLENMSLTQLINHAQKYSSLYDGKRDYHILIWMRDYIDISRQLGVHIDKKNMFPADIKEAHDKLLPCFREYKDKIAEERSKKALEYVNRFFKGYEKDGLMVSVPRTKSDFIREGQELSHCVGQDRYYNNHVKGVSMIFFIRRSDKPEKAFYTAEINMQSFNIIQLYGYGDCPATKEVRAFVRCFADSLKSNVSRKAG